jgi:hypothetical protein
MAETKAEKVELYHLQRIGHVSLEYSVPPSTEQANVGRHHR